MTARKPAAAPEAPAETEAPETPTAETPAEAAPGGDTAVTDAEKDAEIDRLRAAAAESDRKLAALLAGQTVNDAADVEPVEGEIEVRMLITISGLRDGEPWPPAGGTVTLPAAEAAQVIANGYATPVE